jgi:LDH2 family malate/lactate/ureidoglycolate dehydrogenase
LSMTNVGPNLVVPGGAKPITGNNPMAFGVPTDRGFPLILDISMSSVAGGKLLLAKEKGEKIPFGWATDSEGKPTDDPVEGFAGFLLPLGGHKGFGLSLMVDILCGVLSGGAFQFDLQSMYKKPEDPSSTGHLMLVIDPDAFLGKDAFLARIGAFCETIKASPMWDDTARMLIPGELENEMMNRRLKDGIPLPRSLYDDLVDISKRLDCKIPNVITG